MHLEENEYTATCTYEYANPWVSRRYCTVVYVLTMIALVKGYTSNGENVLSRMFACLLFSCSAIKTHLSRGIYQRLLIKVHLGKFE